MNVNWRVGGRVAPLPRLHVSLASSGFAVARGAQAGMVLIVCVSLAVAIWSWSQARGLDRQAAQFHTSLARVQEMNQRFAAQMRKDRLTLTQAEIAEIYKNVEFANRLVGKRDFSWARFLSDLETAVPPRVSIRSVRHSFKGSAVQLKGAVLTLGDLNRLVDKLENHGAFRRVKVSSHRFRDYRERAAGASTGKRRPIAATPKRKKPRQIVEFELTVGYEPDS